MEISLHKAVMEDCKQIHTMQIESFRELLEKYNDYDTNPAAESIDRIELRMAQDNTDYYFICIGNEYIGAIRIGRLNNNICRISPMFILPKYQGKGYGQQVVQTVEILYPQAKHWEIDTIKQESKLCYFYEKMGYKQTGKEENIKTGMDIVFYRKQA